ncbi:hypothetical protein, partial [Zymomonas mobilis]|uniref:hypothetical protein n=1 Tax=Zymomonas mobilis TaxID=542 RepID=UPI001C63C17D
HLISQQAPILFQRHDALKARPPDPAIYPHQKIYITDTLRRIIGHKSYFLTGLDKAEVDFLFSKLKDISRRIPLL